MNLLYKPDWEEAKTRYQAWWAHEAMDRCAIQVTAPRPGAGQVARPQRPPTPEARWTDLDYISKLNDLDFCTTYYGGEAFPIWHPGYPGHTAIPAFLGCPTDLDFETGWWDPVLKAEDIDFKSLRIDKQGKWWQFTLRMLRRAVQECQGKAIPSIGAFGACGDTLAAVRGSDRFLLDVMDRPEQVIAAEAYLMDMWCEVYDDFYKIVHDVSEGSTSWGGYWSPGKTYMAQNDFAYMISPKMYRELFLAQIEKQTRFLDHTMYHVDGIGNFAHVPALCELPCLQALQILPGAGKPSALHYLDVCKTVQRAGKNLQIYLASNEVETALSELSARGLMIVTSCKTEAEAKALLENAKKWSKDRKV